MSITRTHTLPPAVADEHRDLAVLAEAARHHAPADLVDVVIGGRAARVTPEVADALGDVLETLAERRAVVIGALDETVTTGRAAQMLGISRTYLCRLVDHDEIPCQYVGTHRRIRTADVLDYAEHRRVQRQAELDRISQLSAQAGLYDDDF